MSEKIRQYKEKIFSKETKRKAFFIFYGFFFLSLILILLFGNHSNKNDEYDYNDTQNEKVKDILSDTKNYSFEYLVNINGDKTVLTGSVYNNEMLITKNFNNEVTKFYIYYNDLYIYNKDKYIKYDGDIIDEFDNKLLNIEYLEEKLNNSSEIASCDSETTYYNNSANITMRLMYNEKASLIKVVVTKGDITVDYLFSNIGGINKFNINVEE